MKPSTDTAMDYADAEDYANFMDELEEQENEQYNDMMEELCFQLKSER